MYITIDKGIVLRHFIMCEFYDVETCFCWNADTLVIFPHTKDSSAARDIRILLTPGSIRKIEFFNSRAFVICTPQGAYKLTRGGEFALLSKNALGMGSEYFQVLVAKNNGVYLDDKQTKTSTLLFPAALNAIEMIRTFPLILENTEMRFVNCLTASWETEKNLCVIAYHRKLFVLKGDTVQLVYTNDCTIMDIIPVKKQDKIAGLLLLLDTDIIIFIHSKDSNLIFEKIHLGRNVRNVSALCAGFSLQIENILWIVYCDQSKMYYLRKELFTDVVQEIRIEEKTFNCIQHYKPNVLLGLSQKQELVELSLEELENTLSIDNNIDLHTGMFQRTDFIMEKICARVKKLNVLYESLADEQDKLRRINLYASKHKFQIIPHIEVSRLCNYCYLDLSILAKLPKNSYVVFVLVSKNRNTFCVKKVTETAFMVKIPINKNRILSSSTINMDLITLISKQNPWCLIENFIHSPPQNPKRKRGSSKKDKTAFIHAKITSLRNLIAEKDLNMTKLCEIKRIIRAEL